MPVPRTAPGNSAAPVAMKQPSSIVDAVDVRVRADEDVVAEPRRVLLAPAHERVLHHHAALADLDRPVLGGQHRAEQDPRVRPDPHVPHTIAVGAT